MGLGLVMGGGWVRDWGWGTGTMGDWETGTLGDWPKLNQIMSN